MEMQFLHMSKSATDCSEIHEPSMYWHKIAIICYGILMQQFCLVCKSKILTTTVYCWHLSSIVSEWAFMLGCTFYMHFSRVHTIIIHVLAHVFSGVGCIFKGLVWCWIKNYLTISSLYSKMAISNRMWQRLGLLA